MHLHFLELAWHARIGIESVGSMVWADNAPGLRFLNALHGQRRRAWTRRALHVGKTVVSQQAVLQAMEWQWAAGVLLCLTGFDREQRARIREVVEAAGGR